MARRSADDRPWADRLVPFQGPVRLGRKLLRLGYGATWYPSRPTSDSSSADLGLVRQGVSAAAPIWRQPGDVLILSASVRNSMFFTDAVLPDSGRPFPSELWNISLGTTYLHKFQNGWSGGLGIHFGSASDKPFYSINEMNVRLEPGKRCVGGTDSLASLGKTLVVRKDVRSRVLAGESLT